MANHKWADVAHYYLKSGISIEGGFEILEWRPDSICLGSELFNQGEGVFYDSWEEIENRPILRALEDMTDGEARELIQIFLQSDKYDPIDDSELWFEIHRWDNAALLDGDIAIHFSISARCWEGELAICLNGDFQSNDDETGELYRVTNLMAMVHYLISKGFDVFGLIESNQAIRKGVEGV